MGHFPFLSLIMGKEGVGVAVAIKHSSNFRISVVKTAFWFCLRLHRLLSSENQIVRVASRSRRTKPSTKHGNMLCDWFILLLLLLTLAIWFSLDHKQWSHKQSWKKMEKIWFFLLQFLHTLLTTQIFYFHWIISALTTPLTTPMPTLSLAKTSLQSP